MLYELIDAACSNSILSLKILFHFRTTSYRTGSKIYTTMDIRPWLLNTKTMVSQSPLTSVQQVCDFLTAIIFTCSCQHAAVNFSQLDMYGFPPHSPALMRKPPPTERKQHTESEVMECLPTKDQAEKAISTVYDLTRIFPDEVSFCQKNCKLKRTFRMQILVDLKYTLIQHNFFHEIRTPTENKHARIVEIG